MFDRTSLIFSPVVLAGWVGSVMAQVDWLVDFYVLVLLLPLSVIRDTVILELPFYSEFSSLVFNLRPHPTFGSYQKF